MLTHAVYTRIEKLRKQKKQIERKQFEQEHPWLARRRKKGTLVDQIRLEGLMEDVRAELEEGEGE